MAVAMATQHPDAQAPARTSGLPPKWAQRALIAAFALIAAGAVYKLATLPGGEGSQPSSDIVQVISPQPNDKTLQQGQVRVELKTGWDGSLRIDQRDIPANQLTRSRSEGIAPADQLMFQPGPGKALEYFPAGQNCATLTYWQLRTGPDQSFTKQWCFTSV
jgi:hypothetical protein